MSGPDCGGCGEASQVVQFAEVKVTEQRTQGPDQPYPRRRVHQDALDDFWGVLFQPFDDGPGLFQFSEKIGNTGMARRRHSDGEPHGASLAVNAGLQFVHRMRRDSARAEFGKESGGQLMGDRVAGHSPSLSLQNPAGDALLVLNLNHGGVRATGIRQRPFLGGFDSCLRPA
ncbi:hypothetical protein [Kibdelosporangium aridum]|uniref:hypothetical protein n=1 Tax=Kibdelosporangium aridum TaxID=2030 RepID=UPI00190EB581|nr:hypothetical protein [Kibdelosporangium aridum]